LDYALRLHGLAKLLQGVVQGEEFAGLKFQTQISWGLPKG
jgi:hypothetical protein